MLDQILQRSTEIPKRAAPSPEFLLREALILSRSATCFLAQIWHSWGQNSAIPSESWRYQVFYFAGFWRAQT
jgi:hypothetical protein